MSVSQSNFCTNPCPHSVFIAKTEIITTTESAVQCWTNWSVDVWPSNSPEYRIPQVPSNSPEYRSHTDRAFGLYHTDLPGMQLTIDIGLPSFTKPSSMTLNSGTLITVSGIYFANQVTTGFRLSGPPGFLWITNKFVDRPPGVQKDWPCMGDPQVFTEAPSQARWEVCNFQAGLIYGFGMDCEIPDVSPTSALNAFWVEIGYVGTETGR